MATTLEEWRKRLKEKSEVGKAIGNVVTASLFPSAVSEYQACSIG
jgi:hypothetical protein